MAHSRGRAETTVSSVGQDVSLSEKRSHRITSVRENEHKRTKFIIISHIFPLITSRGRELSKCRPVYAEEKHWM